MCVWCVCVCVCVLCVCCACVCVCFVCVNLITETIPNLIPHTYYAPPPPYTKTSITTIFSVLRIQDIYKNQDERYIGVLAPPGFTPKGQNMQSNANGMNGIYKKPWPRSLFGIFGLRDTRKTETTRLRKPRPHRYFRYFEAGSAVKHSAQTTCRSLESLGAEHKFL